jgi:uncharacterized protein DUF6675
MGWFRSVPYPILLAVALMLMGSVARAEDLPRPPCMASPPEPGYAADGHTPNIRVWNRREQTAPWVPPACTGWTAKGSGVLVAVAGSFSGGSGDDLLKRFASISRLQGLLYWSVSESGWRTLITHATALEGADLDHPRQDFSLAEMKEGEDLYFAQSDNRTSGDVVYRMEVKQADPSRLVIAIDNVTAVRRFLVPLFEPGDLQSVHYLERTAQGRWSYYGLAWAGEQGPSLLQMPDASYVNRALAFYRHFATSSRGSNRVKR